MPGDRLPSPPLRHRRHRRRPDARAQGQSTRGASPWKPSTATTSVFEPAAIPAVVFTDPELAWAGLTETEAKRDGRKVEVVKFPWAASGRSLTLDRTDGLTKLVIEPGSERVLGVGIVGPGAGELIAEGTLAIEMGAVVSDLKLTIHAHPTLSETVMESAEMFFGHATHVYRPKTKIECCTAGCRAPCRPVQPDADARRPCDSPAHQRTGTALLDSGTPALRHLSYGTVSPSSSSSL